MLEMLQCSHLFVNTVHIVFSCARVECTFDVHPFGRRTRLTTVAWYWSALQASRVSIMSDGQQFTVDGQAGSVNMKRMYRYIYTYIYMCVSVNAVQSRVEHCLTTSKLPNVRTVLLLCVSLCAYFVSLEHGLKDFCGI